MISRGNKITVVLILWLIAVILSAALPAVPGHCENLRFVFMADGRGDSLDNIVNMPILSAIESQILALDPRPSFVIYGGDSVYRGYSRGTYNFQTFKEAMAPLTNQGIKLYTVMGNHELYTDSSTEIDETLGDFFVSNQQEFQKEFTDNPSNGPAGYERLVYSFTSPEGDALFVVGDCYYITQDSPSSDLDGNFDFTQLAWLNDQFTQSKATHKFFFVHAPYYYITSSNAGQHTTFTQLWSILDNNHVDLMGCGHTHLYARKAIDSSIAPNPQISPPVQWQHNVTQLITGTCGAPPDTDTPTVDRYSWHFSNNMYYFSVIDIHGPSVAVTSYGGPFLTSPGPTYRIIDHFNIPPITIPATDLLLLQ